MRIPLAGWVAPFGDPGITDRSHLPRAFRSVPRPSSPLSAKASTRCPSFALERHTQRQKSSRDPALPRNSTGQCRWPNDAPAQAGAHHGPPFGASAMRLSARRNRVSPRHSSLLGGTCKAPPLEDTIGIPHAHRPLGQEPTRPATGGSRLGHTTRYSHLSINNHPRRPSQAFRRQSLSSCRVSGSRDAPAGPFGVAAQRLPAGRNWRCDRGGGERDRTDDLLLAKQALSQLSYTPFSVIRDQGSVIRTAAARLQPRRSADGAAAIGSDY